MGKDSILHTLLFIYCIIGAVVSFGLFIAIGSIEPSTKQLSDDIQLLARLSDDASLTAYNFAATLNDATQSLTVATNTVGKITGSINSIADVLEGLPVVGQSSSFFRTQSVQFSDFQDALNKTTNSFGTNVRNMQQIGMDLELVTQRLEIASGSVKELPVHLGVFSLVNLLKWFFLLMTVFHVLFGLVAWKKP